MRPHDLLAKRASSFPDFCRNEPPPVRQPPADPARHAPAYAPDGGATACEVAASVRQRLFNLAHERSEDFPLLLTSYAIERLLYRLSRSPHAAHFILKGSPLFPLWGEGPYRATRDLDLSGPGNGNIHHLEKVFREICRTEVVEDGMQFLEDTVQGEEIPPHRECGGLRITLKARIAQAQLDIQVDIGFGDMGTPRPQTVELPTILKLPAPRLKAYSLETFIAEKFEAMILLGIANGRMRDFYDVWTLARRFTFEGRVLSKALRDTFAGRKTRLPEVIPLALTPKFYNSRGKKALWKTFFDTGRLRNEKTGLGEVASVLREFLMPPALAASSGTPFGLTWSPSGPWS